MAFQGIDRQRFEYLLSAGSDDFELRRFFAECRTNLIQHGGRVQNLPKGFRQRVRTLARELPPSSDGVLQSWFAKNLTMVDPEDPEKIVEEFRIYEELSEPIPESEAKRLARSSLVRLFCSEPHEALLAFLRSSIGAATEGVGPLETAEEALTILPESQITGALEQGLSRLLVDLLEGRDVDESLAVFPPDFGTFVTGLQASSLGQTNEALAAAAALAGAPDLRLALEGFINRLGVRRTAGLVGEAGLKSQSQVRFNDEFVVETDEVLGYCTNAARPNAVFVRPIAIVRADQVLELHEGDAVRLFPETGDIIAFPGASRPQQPVRGQVGVWRVAKHDTEKPTHFHLASERRPVFETRMVPFPSSEHDSVRQYLQDVMARESHSLLQPPLFQLSDGLLVAGRTERTDWMKDETFELGLPAWFTLPAVRLDGRMFVVGPLPKEQLTYECGTLVAAARSLFRSKGEQGSNAGLTRKQLRDLAQSLGDADSDVLTQRLQRVQRALHSLAEQDEAIEFLVERVSKLPEVRARVDELVALDASRSLALRDEIRVETDRLRKERDEWDERVRRQKEEHKRLKDETARVVRSAFERARDEGLPKLLTEAAIFQAIAPRREPADSASIGLANQIATAVSRSIDRMKPEEGASPADVLRRFGIGRQAAAALVALSDVVHAAGLVLFVSGPIARPAVEAWASALSLGGEVFDASVGLLDDGPIRSVIGRNPTPPVLLILDANLAALDIYCRALSDAMVAGLAGEATQRLPRVFMTLSEGLGSLPVPRTFDQIAITVDLSRKFTFRSIAEFEDFTLEDDEAWRSGSFARLWKLGAQRLKKQIACLPGEERALVLSILAGAD